MSRSLVLNERQHLDLSGPEWRDLSTEPEFWELVRRGVLRVGHPARGQVRLEATKYLGRAFVGPHTIQVNEKVPGALPALLDYASAGAFRLERLGAPATDIGSLARLLVRQFLERLREYASAGREGQYARRRERASLIAGRLDVTRTIALKARGLAHIAAFDRSIYTHLTGLNRVMLATLTEIERSSALLSLSQDEMASARGLAVVFDDCRDFQVLFGERSSFVDLADQLSRDMRHTELLRDLLALAGVILGRVSFEPMTPQGTRVPRSWFLNLEDLFEKAVRRVLRKQLPSASRLSAGSSSPVNIFSDVQDEFAANPDLVIRVGSKMASVGDVKYKNWTGSAAASDLYQLLTHAGAFSAKVAFLVFPHDAFEERYLGDDPFGCRTWLFAVDVTNLQRDLGRLSKSIGLPSGAAAA